MIKKIKEIEGYPIKDKGLTKILQAKILEGQLDYLSPKPIFAFGEEEVWKLICDYNKSKGSGSIKNISGRFFEEMMYLIKFSDEEEKNRIRLLRECDAEKGGISFAADSNTYKDSENHLIGFVDMRTKEISAMWSRGDFYLVPEDVIFGPTNLLPINLSRVECRYDLYLIVQYAEAFFYNNVKELLNGLRKKPLLSCINFGAGDKACIARSIFENTNMFVRFNEDNKDIMEIRKIPESKLVDVTDYVLILPSKEIVKSLGKCLGF